MVHTFIKEKGLWGSYWSRSDSFSVGNNVDFRRSIPADSTAIPEVVKQCVYFLEKNGIALWFMIFEWQDYAWAKQHSQAWNEKAFFVSPETWIRSTCWRPNFNCKNRQTSTPSCHPPTFTKWVFVQTLARCRCVFRKSRQRTFVSLIIVTCFRVNRWLDCCVCISENFQFRFWHSNSTTCSSLPLVRKWTDHSCCVTFLSLFCCCSCFYFCCDYRPSAVDSTAEVRMAKVPKMLEYLPNGNLLVLLFVLTFLRKVMEKVSHFFLLSVCHHPSPHRLTPYFLW